MRVSLLVHLSCPLVGFSHVDSLLHPLLSELRVLAVLLNAAAPGLRTSRILQATSHPDLRAREAISHAEHAVHTAADRSSAVGKCDCSAEHSKQRL